jgi:anaerobic selenocysteine-containing dehydrogenase
MIGVGFQKSVQGAESVRAVALLPALVGLHRGFFYSNSSAYFTDIPYLTGESFVTRESKIVSQVALGSIMEQGDFKFVYIYNMNPALTIPNQEALRKGLSRNDVFVVVHETHWTETIPFADIVLPACTYLEKDDLAIAWAHRHVMISRKPIVPQGESRDEVWVMHEIARRLEMSEEWLYEPPWNAMEKTLQESLETGTFADLVKGETLELKCRGKSEYQTQSGLIEFSSKEAEKNGFRGVPIQISLEIPEGQFILLTSSLSEYSHTQFQEVYGLIPSVVHIHPLDAGIHKIQDGDAVKLSNEMGEMQLTAVVSKSVPAGVLWTPSLGVGLKGKPQNSLISCITQTLGGGSTFNSSTVFLTKD